jgi:hypothetical protein
MVYGALPSPYPEENPHSVRIPTSMCMSVTGNEAGMSKTVIEFYGNLPQTYGDTEFLADRSIMRTLASLADVGLLVTSNLKEKHSKERALFSCVSGGKENNNLPARLRVNLIEAAEGAQPAHKLQRPPADM